tara:strand:- start:2163 stop:2702 length:540 start_codon:yes stop_codon:yes gene_type:complete
MKAYSVCTPTPTQPKGPFYKKIYDKSNNDMTNNGEAIGKKIKVYGNIFDSKCRTIPKAKIEIWQANSFGKYNHKKDLSKSKVDNNFNGYTKIHSNEKGEYFFFTVYPGHYKMSASSIRTPHIHFKITTNNKSLTTQMYFKGNKMNESDYFYKKNIYNNGLEGILNSNQDLHSCEFNIII